MVTVFLTNGKSIDIAGGVYTEYKDSPLRLQVRDNIKDGNLLAVFYLNNIAGYEFVEEIIGEYNE